MRLWTVQSEEVYQRLNSTGVHRCDGNRAHCLNELEFEKPYRWMAAQMAKRIGPPPDGVVFPVWAWHTRDWVHKRPDMRRAEFRTYQRPVVLLEVEIPDSAVLLSDEELWHFVLNGWYLSGAMSEAEYEEDERSFDMLPEAAQQSVKEQSWEAIFNVSPPLDTDWCRVGCYIQATFWELRKEHIVKAWHCK